MLALILLTPLVIVTPMVRANPIYSGKAGSKPRMWPPCKAYVMVDTSENYLDLQWNGPVFTLWPLAMFWFADYVIWDDAGFEELDIFLGRNGQVGFYYPNTHTWLHVEVTWTYTGIFIYHTTARIDIYIGE